MGQGTDLDKARAAKAKALSLFSSLAQVNGVGITGVGGGYGVKVNLAEPLAEGVHLPDEIDGVPVVVEFVGPIRKRGLQPRKSKGL